MNAMSAHYFERVATRLMPALRPLRSHSRSGWAEVAFNLQRRFAFRVCGCGADVAGDAVMDDATGVPGGPHSNDFRAAC